jgi:hypothetical protein
MPYWIASIALMPLISLAVVVPHRRRRGRPNQWGLDPDEVKSWVYQVAQEYPHQLNIRTIFYRLGVTRGFPSSLPGYKRLVRWMRDWREKDSWLHEKIEDYTRNPKIPEPPGITHIEVWMEKFIPPLQDLLAKYRVTALITRGYGSISMFRDSLRRAEKRGVSEVLYFGDVSPSGIDILRINRERMPVKVRKIALTWSQIRRYKLLPRPCKPKDRRFPAYVARHGNQAFDIESLDPKKLREIVEKELGKLIPPERLRELERREEVERAAVELVRELLELGVSPAEITRRLGRARRGLRGKNFEKSRKF